MIELFGIIVFLGGAIAISSANLSKISSLDRGWALRMQREVFDAGSVLPKDIDHATGTIAGRNASLSLSSRIVGFGTRRRIIPMNLTAGINCACPISFVVTKLVADKNRPLRAESLSKVAIQKRDVIDAQGKGKPLVEQILSLQECGQLHAHSSDVSGFRQWQLGGDAANLMYELLFTHSVDSIMLLNERLEVRTLEPTSNAIGSQGVRAMLQTMIALASDLETRSPTR